MVDFENPERFAELLDNLDLSEDLYNALRSTDPAEPIIAAIDILRRIRALPKIENTNKSMVFSEKYRRKANDAYLKKEYQFALEHYNKALLYAPPNSHSMKLAYSNRSAVLIKMHAYQACLYDIDTCFTMGCPAEVVDKLKRRKDEAYEHMWKEKLGLAILYLDDKQFFPQSGNSRSNAIKAFSRMLMCLYIHGNILQLLQTVTVLTTNNTKYHDTPNYGFFPFMSKLKHDCDANSLYVALNNKLALVALKPIQRGTEITASQLPHWLDLRKDMGRKIGIYKMFRLVCDCPGCNGNWEALASNYELNEEQSKVFQRLNIIHLDNEVNSTNVHQVFPILCKALVTFYQAPYCYQTVNIQKVFRKCILILQNCATSNVLLGPPSSNFF